jgi:sugar/nucleoside kinase (ribokinase family)
VIVGSHRRGLYFRPVARTPAIDLLTVGESFEDLVFFDLPRMPRSGEELKTSRFAATVGGGAVITAIAAARLGLRTEVVSGLPAAAVPLLRREGVRIRNVRRPNEPHAISVSISTPRDRSFVTFNGVNDAIEPRLAAALRGRPGLARHVHFALAPSNPRLWIAIVNRLRTAGTTTSWDFGWHPWLRGRRAFRQLIASVDVLFVNEAESKLYARERRTARATVIKLGARGSRWTADAGDLHIPAPRVRVVDTTGAGDAFNGGFLSAYLEGRSPRECLRRGNAVGARSTLAPGGIQARGRLP